VSGANNAITSLEAAMWCVGTTESFEEAVLAAANLGDDAGSTAALAGQLAGALYGACAIPDHWLEQLAWRDRIADMADAVFDHSAKRG
jgi:ADP-ribosyl-[dinitrogen reductase] hydrolase